MDLSKIKYSLGKRIKSYRISKQLTQEQFCSIIGLEQPNLSNIETGKCLPDIETVCKIIVCTDIEPNFLFDFNKYCKASDTIVDNQILKKISELSEESKIKIRDIIDLIHEK